MKLCRRLEVDYLSGLFVGCYWLFFWVHLCSLFQAEVLGKSYYGEEEDMETHLEIRLSIIDSKTVLSTCDLGVSGPCEQNFHKCLNRGVWRQGQKCGASACIGLRYTHCATAYYICAMFVFLTKNAESYTSSKCSIIALLEKKAQ